MLYLFCEKKKLSIHSRVTWIFHLIRHYTSNSINQNYFLKRGSTTFGILVICCQFSFTAQHFSFIYLRISFLKLVYTYRRYFPVKTRSGFFTFSFLQVPTQWRIICLHSALNTLNLGYILFSYCRLTLCHVKQLAHSCWMKLQCVQNAVCYLKPLW
jgi:hypothetical protein